MKHKYRKLLAFLDSNCPGSIQLFLLDPWASAGRVVLSYANDTQCQNLHKLHNDIFMRGTSLWLLTIVWAYMFSVFCFF